MKKLSFILLSATLNIERVIDVYKSEIWTERYYESGDFELYLPATRDLIEAVNFDYYDSAKYICREDDTTKCGIIERINITTDVEQGNYLTISGRTLDGLIFQRIYTFCIAYSPHKVLADKQLSSLCRVGVLCNSKKSVNKHYKTVQ